MHGVLPLPGDEVWIRQRRWRVERAWRDRHVVRLDVASRDRRITFLTPFDQPLVRSDRRRLARARRQQAAARAAGLIASAPDLRLPTSAITARLDVLPYQLAPVLATIAGHTRLLLADDVGLGKTIQAGLIVAELVRREPAPRILLLVPAPLRDQWIDELRSRFSLSIVAADRGTLATMGRAGAFGENPWRRAGVWIASPDFLKQRHVFESLPPDAWDLLVVDEAHVACGDSDRFETCQAVARRARRVVMLTATPHSGDVARYARLVDIGSLRTSNAAQTPDLLVFRRTRRDIGMPSTRRIRWHHVGLCDAEHRALAALASYERAVLSSAGPDAHEHALLLLTVLRKRALSTFAALSRSISRRLGWLGDSQDDDSLDWVQPRLGFEDMTDDAAEEEHAALTAHTGLDAGRERVFLRQLRGLADEAARRDSKVQRLVELINRTAEPVVAFSEFRDSLEAVERRLHAGRAIAVLHGAQDPNERRLHLKRFLEGTASVLLATDVAGQGLNLQTRARWVASLELPWNPARLEQRIGRVDRLGQRRVPHLTLLVARHEAETGLLRHLARRVLTARRSFAEDLLPSLLPSDAAVRATLLRWPLQPAPVVPRTLGPLDLDQPSPAPPAVSTSRRRWQRRADVVAREITRRRNLAHRWRAPEDQAGRALWTPGNGVVLCSVPLLNDRDELVARLMVAATLHGCPVEIWRAREPLTQSLRQALDRHITRFARKISRRWRVAGSRLAERERVVSAFICQSALPGEIQHTLFDNRAGRAAQAAIDEADQTSLASTRIIDRWSDDGSLRGGPLSIEVAWIPPG